ncbi:MAG: DUF5131 family protein [Patescibacteria group bacterium]
MGANSKIAWTDHTFNPWWGCTKVSAGCDNCYAEAWAKRTGHQVFGADVERRFFGEAHWQEPLVWNIAAENAGVRRRVFCGSMCDVFEDRGDRPTLVERFKLCDLIEMTPAIDWLLLTKRPENMNRLAPAEWAHGWPKNIVAMTTVEGLGVGGNRIKALLSVPVARRGLSLEPLLAPVNLRYAFAHSIHCAGYRGAATPNDLAACDCGLPRIHWLIIGCEKLPGNRPGRACELGWVRDLVVQGRGNGAAVFVKQLEVDGRVSTDPSEWPEDLRVQEFPRWQR